MSNRLRWGIIATGRIANAFAEHLAHSRTGTLTAIASRTHDKAETFAQTFSIQHAHASYQDLLNNPEVDAVYISTPHPSHAEWAIKAAEAGKHILCEKPMTMNHAEAVAVCDAAAEHDVFFMEAFMYRCHPQTTRLVELVQSRAIGDLRLIRATFSFGAGFDADSRIWNNALGGGAILDVGCYTMSMARLMAGAAGGKPFVNPTRLNATGLLHPQTGVDVASCANLEFPGGILAQLSAGIGLRQDNKVILFGTEGSITVENPWIPLRKGGQSIIRMDRHGEDGKDIVVETDQWLYAIEADTVAAHINARQAPAMTVEDSLGNIQSLDRWRAAIGLIYESEKAAAGA